MRRLAPFVLLACLSVLAGTALAVDRGQFGHVPPDIRAWFKSVIAPNGVPCCDQFGRTSHRLRRSRRRLLGPDRGPVDAGARPRGHPRSAATRSAKPWCGTCITAAASSSAASCRRTRCEAP